MALTPGKVVSHSQIGGIQVKMISTGRFKPPVLDMGQLTDIGRRMVRAQKIRWGRSYNADGNPAKKLTQKYYNIKRKMLKTGNARRDMVLTGLTKENFTLRKAMNGVIRAENTSREGRRRARQADQYDQMIGFAPSDERLVFLAAADAYKLYLRTGWQVINVP